MAHIRLPEHLPGILGLMAFRPETARPLNELADILLRGPSTLSPADRELIATVVSSRNDCFCQAVHGAVAAYHLGGDEPLVQSVTRDLDRAQVSDKLRALLSIAAKVQCGGKNVGARDVDHARSQGATDMEIHDVVLIAAAFSMYNRYVDGLATWAPTDPQVYRDNGAKLAQEGYLAVQQSIAASAADEL